MKLAKPDDKILSAVRVFKNACELVLEKDSFPTCEPYDQWKKFDDDDPDKEELLRIAKSIAKEEGIKWEKVDGRIVAYEYLSKKYTHRLWHVIMTAEVLMDNVCDPTEDTVEFHPGFEFFHVAPEQ